MKISYDLHIHSCLSPCGDNDMTPNNIVNMALLLGLDAIAVSDHNSCRNLPAIMKVAEEKGLLVVPAMEACTNEEVHVLCLFPTVKNALAFSDKVYAYLPPILNDASAFGDQLIMNENDEVIANEDKLLINAFQFGIDKLLDFIAEFAGVAVPAHVDKSSYSIISSLGFIPEEYGFATLEVKNPEAQISFNGRFISNSDAHYLEHIQEPTHFMNVEEKSAKGIIQYLKKGLN